MAEDDDKKPGLGLGETGKQTPPVARAAPKALPPAADQPASGDQGPRDPVTGEVDRDKQRVLEINKLKSERQDIASSMSDAAKTKAEADAAYVKLVTAAAENNLKLSQMIGQPNKRPTTLPEYVAREKLKDSKVDLVPVMIPKGFQHRLDDHTMIDVPAGVRKVPRDMAHHWWFLANGAMPLNDDAEAA